MVPSERQTVLHSWGVPASWDAPTIVRAGGSHFQDEEGHAYLDMSSLAECMNLGHQHPRIVRAIQEQAARLCMVTAAWGAEPRARLAEALLERSGFAGGRVYFTLGGADANESAVKIARLATGRPQGLILTRERSYHGASIFAGALSGDARTQGQQDPAPLGIRRVPPLDPYRCAHPDHAPQACGHAWAEALGNCLAAEPGCFAAVLMEPNAGSNGVVPPDEAWTTLRRVTREQGVLLVADEVMSGFGRCGEWFAWQRHGEAGRPDVMTLSKGLTGGHLPLGAVVLAPAVAAAIEHRSLATGLTYCGHPLACAAGLAALEAYEEEDLIARSRRLGAWLNERLHALRAHHPSVGDVRGGHGLFAVLDLVKDRTTREPLVPWGQESPGLARLVREGRQAGVSFAVRSNLILLAPPLNIAEADLRDALDLLDRLLADLERTIARGILPPFPHPE
jgi:taurine---2-oxoglutarate transaminase